MRCRMRALRYGPTLGVDDDGWSYGQTEVVGRCIKEEGHDGEHQLSTDQVVAQARQ